MADSKKPTETRASCPSSRIDPSRTQKEKQEEVADSAELFIWSKLLAWLQVSRRSLFMLHVQLCNYVHLFSHKIFSSHYIRSTLLFQSTSLNEHMSCLQTVAWAYVGHSRCRECVYQQEQIRYLMHVLCRILKVIWGKFARGSVRESARTKEFHRRIIMLIAYFHLTAKCSLACFSKLPHMREIWIEHNWKSKPSISTRSLLKLVPGFAIDSDEE